MRASGSALLCLLLLALATIAPTLFAQSAEGRRIYLPLLRAPALTPTPPPTPPPGPSPTPGPPLPAGGFRVNAPFFDVPNLDAKFGELAVFWFGRVTPAENYVDVRVGYSATELYIYAAVFDRRLWFDDSPQAADLTSWDALTLYLDTGAGTSPGADSHRLVAQLSGDGGAGYQAAYRAGGGAWTPAATPFTARPGWRGERLNDDGDDRGWVMTYRIPFTSLGLDGRPADGTTWRLALQLHDRDDRARPAIAAPKWPPAADFAAPATWGSLAFGLPAAGVPPGPGVSTISIRQGENGAVVPDAGVGGGSVCGDGLDFWSQWGDSSRDAGKGDFNVQNQSDIADWPCFAKYYVTFPLDSLPPGRRVVSATLVLHQFGNSQPSDAKPSLIQALVVGEEWQERNLTWNNAPLARENVGSGWVAPLPTFAGFPGVRREITVTRGVAQAYAAGTPLRLALYSADSDYHSGKYFVSSDTGDWNAVARPTLLVTLSPAP